MLEEKLNHDLKDALKGQNKVKLLVIRMLKADIHNMAIKLKKKSLSDNDILMVLQRHVRQRNESIEQFKKGDRFDLVEKEQGELAVLKTYLPEQLSDDELKAIIHAVIEETGATTKKDMGKVIKATLEKAQGRADGKRVSQAVQPFLGASG